MVSCRSGASPLIVRSLIRTGVSENCGSPGLSSGLPLTCRSTCPGDCSHTTCLQLVTAAVRHDKNCSNDLVKYMQNFKHIVSLIVALDCSGNIMQQKENDRSDLVQKV